MNEESNTTTAKPPPRKIHFAATLFVAALALLAFEAFYYFSEPALDAQQKMLRGWVGVRAPDFTVTNLDGQTVHLADLKGRRVILNFWATWCVPCQQEIPNFIKLCAETSPTNVVILGLSPEDMATQTAFARRNNVNYPLAVLQ
ncbi:MAG TPA: peroxiredoxin family protein, partial [Verrucomicrobiae bacterium]|nr:peroxiredoxin family protein [Verrucomicrobiae bacterium]